MPRRDRFAAGRPEVVTVVRLQEEIRRYGSAYQFMKQALNVDFEARAQTLADVTDWMASLAGTGPENDQTERLKAWAARASASDPGTLRIRGFGLSGFRYLRMLPGADATKPDLRMRQWVSKAIGRTTTLTETDPRRLVSDRTALRLLEEGTQKLGLSLRDTDTTIWETMARPRSGDQRKAGQTHIARHARSGG